MKEQLTLEMLASYLPYGISLIDEEINEKFYLAGINYSNNEVLIHDNIDGSIEEYGISFLKPIFRNLKTDLTREIEHNGVKFIPIVELLKIKHKSCYIAKEGSRYGEIETELNNNYAKACFKFHAMHSIEVWLKDVENEPHWIVQQLQKWHFWIYDQSYFEKGIILDFNNVSK